jgi:hypothetical protein
MSRLNGRLRLLTDCDEAGARARQLCIAGSSRHAGITG